MGNYFFECGVCKKRIDVGDDMLARRPSGWKRIYRGQDTKLICENCNPPPGWKISLNQ